MTNIVSKKAFLGIALGLLLVGAGCAKQSGAPVPPAPGAAGQQEDAQAKQDAAQVKQDEAAQGQDAAMVKQDDAQAKQDAAMVKQEPPVAMAPREVKVLAKQFSFTPAEIRVKQGEKIRLVVTSDDVSHGFAIPTFNVNLTLEPGKTGTAEFVADKKGSFPFFCSVFCGSGHGGMRGTLIVE